jgi:uncharacterized protein YjbI with pentapeptide repeats
MADQSHLGVLSQGLKNWRKWREHYPSSGPDLSGADLSGANLNSAYFNGANLTGTQLLVLRPDLRNADLSETTNLTQEQIKLASGNEQTKLPDHLKRPADWSQSAHE